MPNGTAHFRCTDPTQATVRLVIVLASRIQKNGTEDNTFVKFMKKDILVQPTRPLKEDHKMVPNIPIGLNRNGPFHLTYQLKLPEFWVEWKPPTLKPNFSTVIFYLL